MICGFHGWPMSSLKTWKIARVPQMRTFVATKRMRAWDVAMRMIEKISLHMMTCLVKY